VIISNVLICTSQLFWHSFWNKLLILLMIHKKHMKKKNILGVLLIGLSINVYSQINKVSYLLKYNAASENFETYLKIIEGQSEKSRELVQFNSQISIMTPSNARIEVQDYLLPMTDNNKPSRWIQSSKKNSIGGRNNIAVQNFTPSLSPTGYYPKLNEGDERLLFTFKIYPKPTCKDEVRLFNNETDGDITKYNYNGADFRNGFTLGRIEQLYENIFIHQNTISPQGKFPSEDLKIEQNKNQFILKSGTWSEDVAYSWILPNGKEVTSKNLVIESAENVGGIYKLNVKNQYGCITSEDYKMEERNNNATEKSKLVIYPNPTKDFLNLTVNANANSLVKAHITNVNGQVVQANIISEVSNGSVINKSVPLKLNPGFYIVELNIDERQEKLSFIVAE
jgi:hypothetical protein